MLIVQARRIVGITDIDDFYKLTPNEFRDLCKGALLAQYDRLQDERLSSAMIKPVGFVQNIQEQNETIQQSLDELKSNADSFGSNQSEEQRVKNDSRAFYNLVMKRGRE
ncbi:hypothetical protein [Companilactobacillus zhachilii]|uniref:hypothetical protein n=1 Tax=Companilactobacillus zhachilii TaxID=2304606 RepID=UPI00142338A6|nr:hypothetical protein [Companilactobacillus zhachilii]